MAPSIHCILSAFSSRRVINCRPLSRSFRCSLAHSLSLGNVTVHGIVCHRDTDNLAATFGRRRFIRGFAGFSSDLHVLSCHWCQNQLTTVCWSRKRNSESENESERCPGSWQACDWQTDKAEVVTACRWDYHSLNSLPIDRRWTHLFDNISVGQPS